MSYYAPINWPMKATNLHRQVAYIINRFSSETGNMEYKAVKSKCNRKFKFMAISIGQECE